MNRLKYILILKVFLLAGICSASVTTKTLRCECLNDPLGIDAGSPRLSWILTSDKRGERQTAYQILVASSVELFKADKGDLCANATICVTAKDIASITESGKPISQIAGVKFLRQGNDTVDFEVGSELTSSPRKQG